MKRYISSIAIIVSLVTPNNTNSAYILPNLPSVIYFMPSQEEILLREIDINFQFLSAPIRKEIYEELSANLVVETRGIDPYTAVNPASGASGPWQILASTAKLYNMNIIENPTSIDLSVLAQDQRFNFEVSTQKHVASLKSDLESVLNVGLPQENITTALTLLHTLGRKPVLEAVKQNNYSSQDILNYAKKNELITPLIRDQISYHVKKVDAQKRSKYGLKALSLPTTNIYMKT